MHLFTNQTYYRLWLCSLLMLVPTALAFRRNLQDNVFATPSGTSTDAPPSDSVMGIYVSAAVAADGAPCATVGGDILRLNGTAVDAAIAVSFCLGVTVVESLGVGGGFFMTYYEKDSKNVTTLDCREAAPLAATEDMYKNNDLLSDFGGLAVGVSGATRCYWQMYQRYGGNVAWSRLIDPAISLCEDGYPVSAHLARSLQFQRIMILAEPTMSDFVNPETKDVWLEGDILKQPTLGATHRILQAEPEAIISGSLTDSFLQDLEDLGSIITREDLDNFQPLWKDPVKVTLQNGGYSVYSLPPPSSGVLLGFILNVLDNYNFTSDSISEKNIVTTYQRVVETFEHAYGRRTELGDENYVDMTDIVAELLSESYAYEIFKNITDNTTSPNPQYYGAISYDPDPSGTSNMGVIDAFGNAVALTNTINLYFGAGISSVSTGIVLNDEMGDFSSPNVSNSFGLPPSPANFIEPGKRPLSSMCPTIITDSEGDLVLVTGAAGGSIITSATAWQSMHYLWFGNDLKESVDGRRLHHQLFPMLMRYETDFRMDIVDELVAIGHNASEYSITESIVTSLSRGTDGILYAMSDFRKIASCTDGF